MYSYLCDAGCYTNFYTHLTGRTKAEAVMCAIFEPIASSNANNLGYLRGACGQPAHTPTKPQPHTYTHTPEEINDCDLLHLIAHKPGPSTCSNNFWLSHLSRFASMCGWAAGDEPANERTNEHLRFTVPPINLRPPSRVWPSATDASLKPISMRDMANRPTRGCQTATTAAGAAARTFHFPLYIWFIWSIANKFESSKVLQIHLKVRP